MLIQYIRKSNKTPVAVMLADKNESDNFVYVSWSRCKRGDTFNKKLGVLIAGGRWYQFVKRGNDSFVLPHSMRKHIASFVRRAKKYYKITGKKIIVVDG